jgi:anti-sigma-K factor RskA
MPPTDPQTEIRPGDELVAYLDGELAPEECRRIEDRLAADADYRRQLHELDQAWEALDSLPKPAVNDNFARTTIEMVSVAAQQDVSEQAATAAAVRQRRLWGWAAAALAAAAVGVLVTSSVIPDTK